MIPSFTKDQYELAMFRDPDHMTMTTGDNLTWPEINLLEGLRAGYKALTSWLMGVAGRQAKRTTELGNNSSGDRCDRSVEVHHEPVFLQSAEQPDRADNCINLADALGERYQESEDIALLDEAIQLEREALALRPPGHPSRANTCVRLGTSLYLHYQQAGDVLLLGEAIELHREALLLLPLGHPDRTYCCTILRLSLHVSYERTGEVALLDEAIELERELLALRPPSHPDRAHSCVNLGTSLYLRYKQTGEVALLDEVIELEREVLVLRPPGHPNRSNSCANLAISLHKHYEQTGNVALLDEAIELKREALALRPAGHPNRSNGCVNLASSLQVRFQQTGNVALLDEVLELQREALALQPPGHPGRSSSCANLGHSLYLRFQQTSDVALLNEAIELQREALVLQPSGYPDRANSCAGLAVLLYVRYKQAGDIALLDEAIKLEREALALHPPGHPERSSSCADLAVPLLDRYQETGDVALLDESIELNREALALRPPGHPNRSNNCVNLASSLSLCYKETGDVALLDEAIKLKREALASRPPGHPNRPNSCVSLAVSLCARYEQTGDVTLLNEALDMCSYASKHSPAFRVWYPLTWLSRLHLFGGSHHYSTLEALRHLHQSFQHEVDHIRDFISQICSVVMLVWDDSSIWTPHITALLVGVYTQLVDRLPLMAGFVLNTSSQLRILKTTRRVGSDACVAALLVEQPATAVTVLDRAHGVVWSQALHQRDPHMEGAPKDLAVELEDLLRAIATFTPIDPARVPDNPQDIRHRQNIRIQAILREIRAMPGLARFMLGSTYETLREAARDHPVVVLVAARDHAFALIVPSSSHAGPDILQLDVANDTLQSFANSVGQANLRYRGNSPSGQDDPLADVIGLERKMGPGDHLTHRSPLAKLWLSVVKPVLAHLGLAVRSPRKQNDTLLILPLQKQEDPSRRPRLHWCTAGDFAPLPVHAAGIYAGTKQECCSDFVVSSYTPTLATLLRARRDMQPVPTTEARLLLVAAEHVATAQLPALPSVRIEMSEITGIADRAGIQYAASSRTVATPEEAKVALPSATLVHIACHGLQHPEQPLESAFHLSNDGVLSVSNLMELDLKGAYLAFLSACETAKGDRVQSDQAIHLAATMLFVGFKSVVATMW
jgi:hypothetical protein